LDTYVSSNSSTDDGSDGSQPLKLSNNPVAVASRRLWFKKRTQDDEHVPLHQNATIYLAPRIVGMSHTTGASHIMGASNTAGTSNTSRANTSLAAATHMDANTTIGAGALVGANINLGAKGSASAT
jgi:hypothetical protein